MSINPDPDQTSKRAKTTLYTKGLLPLVLFTLSKPAPSRPLFPAKKSESNNKINT